MMGRAGQLWTDGEKADLRRYFAAGLTLEQTAEVMDRTPAGVCKMAVTLKITLADEERRNGYIRHNWEITPLSVICKALRLPIPAVLAIGKSLGLDQDDLMPESARTVEKVRVIPWDEATIAWAKVRSAAEHVHYLRRRRPISEARIIAGEIARIERERA